MLEAVGADKAAFFRSCVMRLNFLALDRPDIQYAAKEASRSMAAPLQWHWQILAGAARYLLDAPVLVWTWRTQRWPSKLL
eukprot:8071374-Prorocentrum_lima.AAC.1